MSNSRRVGSKLYFREYQSPRNLYITHTYTMTHRPELCNHAQKPKPKNLPADDPQPRRRIT